MSSSSPTRIVYVENANLPTSWAHGRQIMHTCQAFVQAGAEVELVLPLRRNKERSRGLFEYYGLKPLFLVRWLHTLDFIPFVPFSLEVFPYLLVRWTFFYALKRWLDKDWEKNRTEKLFYTRDVHVASYLLKIGVKKVFVELHNDPRKLRGWEKLKANVGGYVVISQGLRQLLLSEGIPSERISIAPDGYDDQTFHRLLKKTEARARLGIDPNVRLFVYTGQLLPWKGVDSLVSALDKIPKDCEVVFVGGQAADLLRLKARIPTDAPQARFIGEVTHEEVLIWLAAADAGILPTSARFAVGREYTSPLKLFEYLAAGLPIIASDVPTSREVLDEKVAVFFKPDDAMSFVGMIARFAQFSEVEREHMSTQAKANAQEYTWEKRGQRIVGFIG